MTTATCRASALARVLVLVGTIVPAAAQGPAPSADAAGALSSTAPTRDAAREQTALKIAGLVVFVANSCPKLRPDYARFRSILGTLGTSEEKLAQNDAKNRYLAYAAAYNRDVAASCDRALTQFGPQGSTLPNLFAPP